MSFSFSSFSSLTRDCSSSLTTGVTPASLMPTAATDMASGTLDSSGALTSSSSAACSSGSDTDVAMCSRGEVASGSGSGGGSADISTVDSSSGTSSSDTSVLESSRICSTCALETARVGSLSPAKYSSSPPSSSTTRSSSSVRFGSRAREMSSSGIWDAEVAASMNFGGSESR